jgi:phosphoribosylaminoimidazolecarboxamide formyltransferase/IMP cyclohydrolase
MARGMGSLDVVRVRRALISVSDKSGLAELGKALAARKVEVLSTGGTAKALREASVDVVEVSEFTGFPEMLDGRVKTLHPKIHGGLLGRRDLPDHVAQMEKHGIAPIDLVVVNLYPFERVAGQSDALWQELIENIDIGGPSMLRSAAKNHDAVAVVCDTADYAEIIASLELQGGTTRAQRRKLALKVFETTAKYDGAIASRLAARTELELPPDAIEPCAKAGLGPVLSLSGVRTSSLRYGENPHQLAAVYAIKGDALDLASSVPLQGKELSYNNLLDADAAIFALRCLVDGTNANGAVIVKHNTPCGAATATSASGAWTRALAGDPVSAFGGIVAFSRAVDEECAKAMADTFLEVVIAPGFTPEARALLAKKSQLRLLAIDNVATAPLPRFAMRSIAGGVLAQEHDRPPLDVRAAKVVTKRAPTDAEWAALDVAFRLSAPVKSNAITLVRALEDGCAMLIGAGGGQTSRVDSVKIAVAKAHEHKHSTTGAALGSDAFFPFADGLLAAADAGVSAVAQPGGSKRDDEVIAAADARNIAMVLTGTRHFRH